MSLNIACLNPIRQISIRAEDEGEKPDYPILTLFILRECWSEVEKVSMLPVLTLFAPWAWSYGWNPQTACFNPIYPVEMYAKS
jgi:hypothetical protein